MKFLYNLGCFILLFSNILQASDITKGWFDPNDEITFDDPQNIWQSNMQSQEPLSSQQKSHGIALMPEQSTYTNRISEIIRPTQQNIITAQPIDPCYTSKIGTDESINSMNVDEIGFFALIAQAAFYAEEFIDRIDKFFDQNDRN